MFRMPVHGPVSAVVGIVRSKIELPRPDAVFSKYKPLPLIPGPCTSAEPTFVVVPPCLTGRIHGRHERPAKRVSVSVFNRHCQSLSAPTKPLTSFNSGS